MKTNKDLADEGVRPYQFACPQCKVGPGVSCRAAPGSVRYWAARAHGARLERARRHVEQLEGRAVGTARVLAHYPSAAGDAQQALGGEVQVLARAEDVERLAAGAKPVVVLVGAAELASGNIERVRAILEALSSTPRRARRLAGRLVVAFDGVDEDPRAVWQSAQCVRWFEAITLRWSHWLRFISIDEQQVGVVVALHAQRHALVAAAPDAALARDVAPQAFDAAAAELAQATRAADAQLGLRTAETQTVLAAALGAVNAQRPKP